MRKRILNKIFEIKHQFENINELIQNYNVIIKYYNFDNIFGFTIKRNNCNIIILNDNLNEEESRFVLLHELGHIILHDDSTRQFSKITQTNKEEIEADLFAVIFGEYTYNESEHWLNKKINYIHCNFLNTIDCCVLR